jgi:NAD(P)H-flavin reductase
MFTCQPLIDYPYQAGQYASIETTHVPREWRPLWIGNPPGTGPLEFHVGRRAAAGCRRSWYDGCGSATWYG